MTDIEKLRGKGPFAMVDGKASDHEIWAADMDPETEAKYDDLMMIFRVNNLAREELARREGKQGLTTESLLVELEKLEKMGIL